jgi:hypothetical protein
MLLIPDGVQFRCLVSFTWLCERQSSFSNVVTPKQLSMIHDLAPVTFLEKQDEFISKRAPKTGEWFLNSADFQEWTRNSKGVLWCPGIRK